MDKENKYTQPQLEINSIASVRVEIKHGRSDVSFYCYPEGDRSNWLSTSLGTLNSVRDVDNAITILQAARELAVIKNPLPLI